jgi:hypothetical protein
VPAFNFASTSAMMQKYQMEMPDRAHGTGHDLRPPRLAESLNRRRRRSGRCGISIRIGKNFRWIRCLVRILLQYTNNAAWMTRPSTSYC